MILTHFVSLSYGNSGEKENHYSYLGDSAREDFGDTFYRNNEFLKCEARNLCKKREKVSELDPLKKYAFFFQREHDHAVVPVFLNCHQSGTSMASMAEALVPIMNDAVLEEGGECVDEDEVENAVNPHFVEDALKAIQGYEKGCPKQNTSCAERIMDNLFDDFKNFTSPWKLFGSFNEGEKVEAGCLTNAFTNIKTSIYETLKLLLYDLPTGVWNLGVSAFNNFMGYENETSSALLNSSIMGKDLADAITSFDFATVYQILRKNFWKFWGSIKEYYLETIGCTEWDGAPYYSTCTKKMNWSCPTCENVMNYACGFISQVGTGYGLGALLGGARSIGAMMNARRTLGKSKKNIALQGKAAEEAATKGYIATALTQISQQTRAAQFKVQRKMKPVTGFFDVSKADVKFIMGAGESFRQLTAAFPGTYLYNIYFQKGKQFGFQKANKAQFRRLEGGPLKRAQGLSFRFDSIRSKFDDVFDDLMSLRGRQPFLSSEFLKIQKELFETIAEQMKGTGITTKILPNGKGMVLTKDGVKYTYNPNFRKYLDPKSPQSAGRLSNDEIKHLMTDRDIMLSNNPTIVQSKRAPPFMREMLEEANTARGIFKVKPDSMDGFFYLGTFGAQMSGIPDEEDCSGKMNGVKLVRMQDITDYPEGEEKTKLEAEQAEREKAEREEEKAEKEAPASSAQ
ncbi:MAG: hypothetical protein NXH75_03410 [Halobacteriovoraceae bacterium]|nr:hypothetical protein [Halobacteriovoraceae bacterium]